MATEVWRARQKVTGSYTGDAAPEVVASNLARILSTGIDGSSFAAIG